MSDTPKFTPGPWEDTGLYIEKNGAVIACAPDHREFSLLEARANARLIAAAPEMYAALEEIARPHRCTDGQFRAYVQDIARAALAKAVRP